jgi:prephenate dehydrogenase
VLAESIGVVDKAYTDPADAVRDADLVFLAMPVQSTEAVLRDIQQHYGPMLF